MTSPAPLFFPAPVEGLAIQPGGDWWCWWVPAPKDRFQRGVNFCESKVMAFERDPDSAQWLPVVSLGAGFPTSWLCVETSADERPISEALFILLNAPTRDGIDEWEVAFRLWAAADKAGWPAKQVEYLEDRKNRLWEQRRDASQRHETEA